MRNTLNVLLDRGKDPVIAVYRIVVGLLFAIHGTATLFGVFGGQVGTGGAAPFAQWPGWWAAALQLVGGLAVVLGLGTRGVAVLCSGSMAYAYFTVHQPIHLLPLQNGGEQAVLFCWAFFLLVFIGPGAWALGPALARTRATAPVRQEALAPVD